MICPNLSVHVAFAAAFSPATPIPLLPLSSLLLFPLYCLFYPCCLFFAVLSFLLMHHLVLQPPLLLQPFLPL